jgi:hypothetical protein
MLIQISNDLHISWNDVSSVDEAEGLLIISFHDSEAMFLADPVWIERVKTQLGYMIQMIQEYDD